MSDGVAWSSNAAEVAADLAAVGVRAGARAFAVTRHFGMLQTTAIQRRASLPRTHPRGPGTGGPRLITGDYVRSWSTTVTLEGGNPTATSGTNRPQGPRLELGFSDTDSAGRRYYQPPYPHARPGHDDVAPAFVEAIAAIPGEV